jgi:sugar O-acyltransferase (sialic acid O-acetyltransferase NeuD family)
MTGEIAIVGLEWDVVDLAESCDDVNVVGFIDPNPAAAVHDLRNLGPDDNWDQIRARSPWLRVALAMDDPRLRARLYDRYEPSSVVSLISPLAHVSHRAAVGPSTILQRNVVVMPYARLGRCCKVNVGAVIHHEAVLGDFVTIAPRASILGRVVIEDRAYVGAGAIIRQRCRVGSDAVVGAGAVVVEDVPPGATVVGVPAKRRLA